jgi:hypothetical protein
MRVINILSESLILTEASVLSYKTFYKADRLEALIDRLSKKDEFLTIDGEFAPMKATQAVIKYLKQLLKTNYDGKGEAININLMKDVGQILNLKQYVKTSDFGGKSVSATGEAGAGNIGPTTEALKSMAIFAKLITRDKPAIDANDIVAIGKKLKKKEKLVKNINPDTGKEGKVETSSAELTVNAEDLRQPEGGEVIKDKISIHINVNSQSFDRAVGITPADKKAWGILQGVINYVNTEGDIGRYSRFFANNVKRDPLNIAVIGLGGAKTDIRTVYQKDKEEKELHHLSMSIKAGSDMYDQASGSTLEGTNKFFNILGLSDAQAQEAIEAVGFVPKPRAKKGDPAESKEVLQARIKAVRTMYHVAEHFLKQEINAMTDRQEGSYINRVLTRLTESIQGKGKLVYVNFDIKGNYHKLNPAQIISLARSVDLDVQLDESKTEPHLYIKDKISGKSIFHVRPAILKTGRITHTFELDHLLDLVKNRPDNTPAPATTNNVVPTVATPPVPATKPAALSHMATQEPSPIPGRSKPVTSTLQGTEFQQPKQQHHYDDEQELELTESDIELLRKAGIPV